MKRRNAAQFPYTCRRRPTTERSVWWPQVLTLLTGATGAGGFKGIGGRFARNGLLSFAATDETDENGIYFKRVDTGAAVNASCNVDAVPAVANQRELLTAVMQGQANPKQHTAFANAWQNRVKRMLVDHADDPALIRVSKVVPESNNA
jgi:hypothetical protein